MKATVIFAAFLHIVYADTNTNDNNYVKNLLRSNSDEVAHNESVNPLSSNKSTLIIIIKENVQQNTVNSLLSILMEKITDQSNVSLINISPQNQVTDQKPLRQGHLAYALMPQNSQKFSPQINIPQQKQFFPVVQIPQHQQQQTFPTQVELSQKWSKFPSEAHVPQQQPRFPPELQMVQNRPIFLTGGYIAQERQRICSSKRTQCFANLCPRYEPECVRECTLQYSACFSNNTPFAVVKNKPAMRNSTYEYETALEGPK